MQLASWVLLLSQVDLNLIRLIEFNAINAIYQIACIDLYNSDIRHEQRERERKKAVALSSGRTISNGTRNTHYPKQLHCISTILFSYQFKLNGESINWFLRIAAQIRNYFAFINIFEVWASQITKHSALHS